MVRGLNNSTDGEIDWMGEFAKGKLEHLPYFYDNGTSFQTFDDGS
jgi:hypothetical protein